MKEHVQGIYGKTYRRSNIEETIRTIQPIFDNEVCPMCAMSLGPASVLGRPIHSLEKKSK